MSEYSSSNALLASLHHERRVRITPPQPRQLQQLPASTTVAETAASVRQAPRVSAPRVRSDAQKCHAQRLQAGQEPRPAFNRSIGGGSSSTHAVSSDFLKHKQEAIKAYRTSYNRCAEAHFSALRDPRQQPVGPSPADASADPVVSLAKETAGRHLRPIQQFVASEATPPPQRVGLSPSAAKSVGARRTAPAPASEQPLLATDRLLRKYGLA